MQAASGKTVITGGTGVVVAPILIWVLSLFRVEMPPEVAAGVAGLLALAVAYFVPAKSGKYVETPEDKGWDARLDGSMSDYATEDNTVETED